MSPTAKWKGNVHAYEKPAKDPNRFPYLPHPYPLKRRGRGDEAHPGGFTSLQEPLQQPKPADKDKEQIYSTYAEWWQAQRPPEHLPNDKESTFSTGFWPYGRRISCLASMDNEEQFYNLDQRVVKNHACYKNRRELFPSTSMSRSQSELLGSQAEHFGYKQSLGEPIRSIGAAAGASFHEQRRRSGLGPVTAGPVAGSGSANKTMWESRQASSPALPTASRQRVDSALSTSRSTGAQAGSRYEPEQSLRNLGLGSRTHAEWCLPQPPAQVNH